MIVDTDAMGGNSGAGSYNQIGVFKAEIVNNFVKANGVRTVVEFGFGDGQQLTRAEYVFFLFLFLFLFSCCII